MPQRPPQTTQDRSQWVNGLSLEQKFWEASVSPQSQAPTADSGNTVPTGIFFLL